MTKFPHQIGIFEYNFWRLDTRMNFDNQDFHIKAWHDFINQVSERTKRARYNKIMKEQKKISFKKNKERIGQIHEGLVIGYDFDSNTYSLRSHFNAPDDIDGSILFKSDRPLVEGEKVKVKIILVFFIRFNLLVQLFMLILLINLMKMKLQL